MPTGYEVQMYRDIERIAKALERIADVLEANEATEAVLRIAGTLETQTFGVTVPEVRAAAKRLAEEER